MSTIQQALCAVDVGMVATTSVYQQEVCSL